MGFACGLVGRVHVRREALEFGRARIDTVEHSHDAHFLALPPDIQRIDVPKARQAVVRNAITLGVTHVSLRNCLQRRVLKADFKLKRVLKLAQEPRVDLGHLKDLIDRVALLEREAKIVDAIRIGRDQALGDEPFIQAR